MKASLNLEKTGTRQLRLSRADRGVLRALAVVAAVGSLFVLIWGGVDVVSWFRTSARAVHLGADQAMAATGAGWTGTFTEASVLVPNLTLGTRSLFAIGEATSVLSVATAFAGASGLFWLVARGGHFHRALTLTASILGAVLAIGSLVDAGTTAFGSILAVDQLSGDAAESLFVVFTLNFGQLMAGLGLLALAFVLSRGEKLEKDTDGLV